MNDKMLMITSTRLFSPMIANSTSSACSCRTSCCSAHSLTQVRFCAKGILDGNKGIIACFDGVNEQDALFGGHFGQMNLLL